MKDGAKFSDSNTGQAYIQDITNAIYYSSSYFDLINAATSHRSEVKKIPDSDECQNDSDATIIISFHCFCMYSVPDVLIFMKVFHCLIDGIISDECQNDLNAIIF